MSVSKIGSWGLARRVLPVGGGRKLGRALRQGVKLEAHKLRAEIITGIRKQSPGGSPFRALSKLTLAARRLRGFRGRKALIRRGELRASITVIARGDIAFVGVPATAGRDRIRIAEVQEFGTDPIIIPITPAMRRFLAVLFKRSSRARKRSKRRGSGTGVVVIQVPARPFLRPSFEHWRRGLDKRFAVALRAKMGWN